MTRESDQFWDKVVKPLDRQSRRIPTSLEEAESDVDAAGGIAVPEEEARTIARHVIACVATRKAGCNGSSPRVPRETDPPVLRPIPEAPYGLADRASREVPEVRARRRTWRLIMREKTVSAMAVKAGGRTRGVVRYAVAAAVMLAVLLGAKTLFQGSQSGDRPFVLLAQAYAGEAQLFAGQRVIHLRNQVVVGPVADATQAPSRGLPLLSLDPTGKKRFHLLALPAEVNKGYTVEDECWYDPPTGRFVRLLTCEGKTLFANAYDGRSVHTLEAAGGEARVVSHLVDNGFQSPGNPAELLGIGAGARGSVDAWQADKVHDAGKTVLADGTEGQAVRVGEPDDGMTAKPHWLVTIRSNNNTVEKMEWRDGAQTLFSICRAKADPDQAPGVGWDLASLAGNGISSGATDGPVVLSDIVVEGISVEQMVKAADFAVYTFTRDPAWAGSRPAIEDALDLGSRPKRMFTIIYQAKDNRHVVLTQSPTYNATFGPLVRQGTLVHTSPAGVKVWGGPRGPWLAQTLLKSSRYYVKDTPSPEAVGYVLETPDGTYPALAINGKVTDEELHVLVDSLSPIKPDPSGQ